MLAAFLTAFAAAAHGCERDTLLSVVNDRDLGAPYVLVTSSGRRLRVYGQDLVNPATWKTRDSLDVCPDSNTFSFTVRNLRRGEELITQTNDRPTPAAPLQIMNGPGFRALVAHVAKRCPASRVRYAPPAALLDADEIFEQGLDSASARKLRAAKHVTPDGDYPRCAGRDGASCPAGEAMNALERAGLMTQFTNAVCAHGPGPWG